MTGFRSPEEDGVYSRPEIFFLRKENVRNESLWIAIDKRKP